MWHLKDTYGSNPLTLETPGSAQMQKYIYFPHSKHSLVTPVQCCLIQVCEWSYLSPTLYTKLFYSYNKYKKYSYSFGLVFLFIRAWRTIMCISTNSPNKKITSGDKKRTHNSHLVIFRQHLEIRWGIKTGTPFFISTIINKVISNRYAHD